MAKYHRAHTMEQSFRDMDRKNWFVEHGGWWVVAQALLLLVACFLPSRSGYATNGLVHPAQFVAVAFAIAGLALMTTGLFTLGKSSATPFPRPREPGGLRTAGIYRLMRHPVYTGAIIACLGWALAWLSPVGVLWVVATAVFFDRKAAHEEHLLRQRYPGYSAYQRRVRRFLPGVY